MSTRAKQITAGIIATILGFLILHCGVDAICSYSMTKEKYDDAEAALKRASSRMTGAADDAAAEWRYLDDIIKPAVDSISWLMDRSEVFTEDLSTTATSWGLNRIYLVDAKGNILDSNDPETSAATMDEAGLSAFTQYVNHPDDHDPRLVTDTGFYYVDALKDGKYLVGGLERPDMIEYMTYLTEPSTALEGISVGREGHVAALKLSDGVFAYCADEDVDGRRFDEVCDGAFPENGYNNKLNIGGTLYYVWAMDVTANETDYRLLALISYDELQSNETFTIRFCDCAYLAVALLIMLYSLFLSDDLMNSSMATNIRYRRLTGRYYINVTILRRLMTIATISSVAILAVSWYVQALSGISRQRIAAADKLDYVRQALEDGDGNYEILLENYDDAYTYYRAESIARSISLDPTLVNDDELTALAGQSGVASINIYDGEGCMEATTTTYKDITLPTDPEDPYSAFWDVVKGYKDTMIVAANDEDSSYYGLYKYMAAKRVDTDNGGMVQVGLSKEYFSEIAQTTDHSHIIRSFDDDSLLALDSTSGDILCSNDEAATGKSSLEYGVDQAALKDDYTGWQTLNGVYCFFMTRKYEDMLLCSCIPAMSSLISTLALSAFTALITGILLIIMTFLISITDKSAIVATLSTSKKTYSQKVSYTVIDHEGQLITTQSADTRWSGDTIPFGRMNAGQKLSFIVKACITVCFLVMLGFYYKNINDSGSMISFIASCRWEDSPNLFSVTYSLLYAIQILIIAAVLRKIVNIISRQFDSRIKTIGRMLESFIKYAAAISILYETLLHFGVEAKALTTGTGLLTLVIGLGANNMIADVIAGIFIVFEGDYRVGDIVTIDKWRGTVQEIGIRTTKIISPGKDIKIIRNSAASGVVNMTRQYSIASVEFSVPAGEDLTEMESHMDELLADIQKHIPELMEGPVYSGVVSYSAGAAMLRISAFCKEADRDEVTNKLNRELKLMFDKTRNAAKES